MDSVTGSLESALVDLLKRFRAGQHSALGQAISLVENERQGSQSFLHELLGVGSRSATRIGFTGPPGAGKSSLISMVGMNFRTQDKKLGVVAVDPTSQYSGGALLGDRIRMSELAADPEIFIRSMATRGSLGGLATTTREVLDLLDAFGLDRILVETVGVGQTELEITAAADTVIVVLVPESGDAIQAMKAGLMEIADIFVVNKADRPGSEGLIKDLRQGLALSASTALEREPDYHNVRPHQEELNDSQTNTDWLVPVLPTVAQSGEGVADLMDTIEAHRFWLEKSGAMEARRRTRWEVRIRDIVDRALHQSTWSSEAVIAQVEQGLDQIQQGKDTPYSISRDILEQLLR